VDAEEEAVSNDRDTRQRLEFVQTRLRDIEPELALDESPGHAEKVAELQKSVREARKETAAAEDRLAFVRSDLATARRAVDEIHLAAQRTQTQHLPELLGLALGLVAVIGGFVLMIVLVESRALSPRLASAVSIGSALILGVVTRARVVPPDARRST
jgi:hypothetical protein